MNPLIASTPKETVQNVSEALNAFERLLAQSDSDLCRLLSPIVAALDHLADE